MRPNAWAANRTLKNLPGPGVGHAGRSIAAMIRADPTLGIDGSTIASVSDYTINYDYDADGNAVCRIPFTVHVTTTILTT